MLSKEQYLDAHSRFYDLLQKEKLLFNKYLPYEEYEIPSSYASGGLWMVFHRMASDFISELLNEINQFYSLLINLGAWEKVLKDYSTDMKFEILIEVLNPILMYSLSIPYIIKNRFIYASVRLLCETAILIDNNSEYRKFSKEYVALSILEEFEALSKQQGWKSFDLFLNDLKQIHGEQHIKETSNFRHRLHHRFPPKIEIGFTSSIRLIENKEEYVSYAFGGESPLSIPKLLSSLYSEHKACIKAFQTFWLLLREQLETWKQQNTNRENN